MKYIIIISLLFIINTNAKAEFNISEIIEELENGVKFLDEEGSLKASRWVFRDKNDLRKDYDELFEELSTLLEIDEINELKTMYRKTEQKIGKESLKLSELKQKRMLAPKSSETKVSKFTPTAVLKGLVAYTKGDYDVLIERKRENIRSYSMSLNDIINSMSSTLATNEIFLTDDQLKMWLTSAIGDEILSMNMIFSGIKKTTIYLGELTKESGENLKYARKYYGMVVILHKIVIYMQEKFIDNIDFKIKPKLKDLEFEAKKQINKAQSLLKNTGTDNRLLSNIKANKLTLKTINMYYIILDVQKEKVKKSLAITKSEEKIAKNTYDTVQISSELSAMIDKGMETFEIISKLQIPEVTEFENKEIEEQFQILSKQISPNV